MSKAAAGKEERRHFNSFQARAVHLPGTFSLGRLKAGLIAALGREGGGCTSCEGKSVPRASLELHSAGCLDCLTAKDLLESLLERQVLGAGNAYGGLLPFRSSDLNHAAVTVVQLLFAPGALLGVALLSPSPLNRSFPKAVQPQGRG